MVAGPTRALRAGIVMLCFFAIGTPAVRGGTVSSPLHQSILSHEHPAPPPIDLDTLGVEMPDGSQLLKGVKVPATIGGDSLVDTMSFLHPTVVHFADGFQGYKLWGAFSLGVDATAQHKLPNENTIVRVSNDGVNWSRFSIVRDGKVTSCPELMFSESACLEQGEIATHFSDPFLFVDANGKLWLGTRANYNQHRKIIIWLRSTADGITWSQPIRALEGSYLAPDFDALLMSPTVWRDADGRFVMWVVDISVISPRPQTRIKLFRAEQPEGPWLAGGVVDERATDKTLRAFPCGANSADTTDDSLYTGRYVPWHIGLIDGATTEKLLVITAVNQSIPQGARPRYYEFLGKTNDGRTLTCSRAPFLGAGPYSDVTAPAFAGTKHVYRASGWISSEAGQREINLLYSLQMVPVSPKDQGWRVARARLRLAPRPNMAKPDSTMYITRVPRSMQDTLNRPPIRRPVRD